MLSCYSLSIYDEYAAIFAFKLSALASAEHWRHIVTSDVISDVINIYHYTVNRRIDLVVINAMPSYIRYHCTSHPLNETHDKYSHNSRTQ